MPELTRRIETETGTTAIETETTAIGIVMAMIDCCSATAMHYCIESLSIQSVIITDMTHELSEDCEFD